MLSPECKGVERFDLQRGPITVLKFSNLRSHYYRQLITIICQISTPMPWSQIRDFTLWQYPEHQDWDQFGTVQFPDWSHWESKPGRPQK